MYECRRAAYIYFTQLKFLQIYGWNVLYTAIEKNSFIAHAGWACSRCDFVEVAAQVAHLYKKLSFTCLLFSKLAWAFRSTPSWKELCNQSTPGFRSLQKPYTWATDRYWCSTDNCRRATDKLQIRFRDMSTSYYRQQSSPADASRWWRCYLTANTADCWSFTSARCCGCVKT